MELFWQVIINGAELSATYALVAVGLTLLFGIMRVFNFAHGEFFMVGAYVVWLVYSVAGWPFLAAAVLSVFVVGVLGIAVERSLFRPLRENPLAVFIGSIGLSFIFQVAVGQAWGVGWPKPVNSPFQMVLNIFGGRIGLQTFIVIPLSFALLGGLWIFMHRIKMGQALRACAQDAETASLQGISIDRMKMIAMALGCALAGVAGAFMAPLISVDPYMGTRVIMKSFMVVIVGGVGIIEGTILAALLFGFLDSAVTTVADSTIANVVGLLIMLIILAVRPRGILGRAQI
ncbi:branched-chain amino acid ABC transporter permease [Chloroflexota bacterium]